MCFHNYNRGENITSENYAIFVENEIWTVNVYVYFQSKLNVEEIFFPNAVLVRNKAHTKKKRHSLNSNAMYAVHKFTLG